jgi:hypothetical protein
LAAAQLRQARYGNVNVGCLSTRHEQCTVDEIATHDASTGLAGRLEHGDSHKREGAVLNHVVYRTKEGFCQIALQAG